MKRRAPLLIVLLLLTAGAAWYLTHRPSHPPWIIEGSGTIEATQVDLAPKAAGWVTVLHAREGDQVKTGQVIAELDGVELKEQLDQAEANLEEARAKVSSARAQLDLERAQYDATLQQAHATAQTSVARVPQAGENLRLQEGTVAAQIQQVRAQVSSAEASLAAATGTARASKDTYRAAVGNLQTAAANLQKARDDDVRYEKLFQEDAVSAQQRDQSHTAWQAAVGQRDAAGAQVKAAGAQRDAAHDQENAARAAVEQSQAALKLALVNRRTVDIRAYDVTTNRAELRQAQAGVGVAEAARARTGQREHDLAAAIASQRQSEAALQLAKTNRENAVLRAPFEGTILSRNVEVGDLVSPGSPMVTIADMQHPYMRVYVGETEEARVKLKQKAELKFSAFPDKIFTGYVDEIRDKAEYIPGNVQTKDERAKLVFGVRLRLNNPEGWLKPGLPADATIDTR